MPWKEVTAVQEKERFIQTYTNWTGTFCALCKEFGIHPKTGYKYLNRYKEEGLSCVKERSREPKRSPNKTKKEMEQLILETRQLNPMWGGDKINHYLQRKGYLQVPGEKTIDRILKRNGLITAQESEKHTAWKRFEHENPNDLWQMDFKGHFATLCQRCHPLTVLDDHSRYSLLIKACANEQTETVKSALIDLFRDNGLPKRMTMDNGSPWGYSGNQLHTQLSVWLMHLGIYVSHSRPNHPQTQGKLERFHRTLKAELLNQYSFINLEDAQEGFDWWKTKYNDERPHEGIGHDVPRTRYKKSDRLYPETLPLLEYDSACSVRKVQQGGIIHFKGKEYRVGEAFYGKPVGLKETDIEGQMDVFFCQQCVIKIDLRYPIR